MLHVFTKGTGLDHVTKRVRIDDIDSLVTWTSVVCYFNRRCDGSEHVTSF